MDKASRHWSGVAWVGCGFGATVCASPALTEAIDSNAVGFPVENAALADVDPAAAWQGGGAQPPLQ